MEVRNLTLIEEMEPESVLKLLRYREFPPRYQKPNFIEYVNIHILENISILMVIFFANIIAYALNIGPRLQGLFFTFGVLAGYIEAQKFSRKEVWEKKQYNPNIVIGDFLMEIGIRNSTDSIAKQNVQIKIARYLQNFIDQGFISNQDYLLIFDIQLWIKIVTPKSTIVQDKYEDFEETKEDVLKHDILERTHFSGENSYQKRIIANLFLEHKHLVDEISDLPKK